MSCASVLRGRKSKCVLCADRVRDLAKRVGEGFCFAQEIELATDAAHEFREVQGVSGDLQPARIGREQCFGGMRGEPGGGSTLLPSQPRAG